MERVTVPVQEGLSNSPADNTATRPQWLPDKFSSAEDMAKSYQELEKEYTRLRQGDPNAVKPTVSGKEDANDLFKQETAPAEVPEQPEAPQTIEEVQTLLPGFSEDAIVEFSNTAWENGELTDEQYGQLEKAGYAREIVDQYIQGQMALVEQQRSALVNAGGGEQAVQAMFDWAARSLPEAEIARYNEKFEYGGPDALMAMEHLKSRFAESGQAFGLGATTVKGANAPGYDTSFYTSVQQVTKDMQSPEYKHDPAFRQKVAEKLARSKVL